MRLLVFGASGRTGRQIVRQALEQGHEVTAFVRAASAQRLAAVMPPHANLTLTAGDVLDPAVVDKVVAVREGAADGRRLRRCRRQLRRSDLGAGDA